MDRQILTFETAALAAEACGDRILELLAAARSSHGHATLAISGGSSPKIMFEAMARRPFDWSGVHLFWVDERCVPPDHELSNFGMTSRALLDSIRLPEAQIHRIHGELPPEQAASQYIAEMQAVFALKPGELPAFDVIHRGMGPDGHTASLFPGEPLILDRTHLAASVWVEKMGNHRVTLLPGVLEAARHTLCLVTGADKAEALAHVLAPQAILLDYPAALAATAAEWYVEQPDAARSRL